MDCLGHCHAHCTVRPVLQGYLAPELLSKTYGMSFEPAIADRASPPMMEVTLTDQPRPSFDAFLYTTEPYLINTALLLPPPGPGMHLLGELCLCFC